MFKRTLYLECKKAIRNRLFIIAIAIGCMVTLCSLIPQVKSYYRGIQVVNGFSEVFQHRNPHAAMNTLYNHWVGGETYTLGSSVYFLYSLFGSNTLWLVFLQRAPHRLHKVYGTQNWKISILFRQILRSIYFWRFGNGHSFGF